MSEVDDDLFVVRLQRSMVGWATDEKRRAVAASFALGGAPAATALHNALLNEYKDKVEPYRMAAARAELAQRLAGKGAR
jgi:hypothetical protein